MGRADGRQPAGVQGWIELFRSLGQALFEVLRAEARALGEDFRRSGAELARGLALLGGAAALGFWTLGALVLTLIAVLAIWLPPWAAALIVTALFAGAAGLLALLGIRRLQRFESPAESIRQRVSDHLDWWNHRLLAEPAVPAAPAVAGGGRGRLASEGPGDAAGSPGSPGSGGSAGSAGNERRRPAPGSSTPPRIHPDDPLEEDDL
ncbi:MAG TPA: phage holin family protein [Thermoanaerobaculia bacterium]|nr:phage holin family protein [Thermoanaerobaculia bacterium]